MRTLKYDWEAIQKFYDDGHSIRDCQEKFGFGSTACAKAKKAGRFHTRPQAIIRPQTIKSEVALGGCSVGGTAKFRVISPAYSENTWKAERACNKFEWRALEKGFIVSKPNFECAYDRVVDVRSEARLYRVQVKYTDQFANGSFIVNTTRHPRKGSVCRAYTNEIDIIAAYFEKLDKVYWLEKDVWCGKLSVVLRYDNPSNGQEKNIRWAQDYEW